MIYRNINNLTELVKEDHASVHEALRLQEVILRINEKQADAVQKLVNIATTNSILIEQIHRASVENK